MNALGCMHAFALLTALLGAEDPASPASRGERLAQTYCQSCHLLPAPSLLDKKTWSNGALRRMAPHLGVARVNLDARPDGAILKEAGVFPNQPLISEDDWRALCQYFVDAAPEHSIPQPPRSKIATSLKDFRPRRIDYPGAAPMVTLVQIDSERKLVYVGNAKEKCLDLVAFSGERLSRIPLDSAPSSLTVRTDGLYVTLIGSVFPSDEKNGKLVRIEDACSKPRVIVLLEGLQRPSFAEYFDLNGDSRDDILLCSFGNYLGRLSWFETLADGKLREHPLLEQPGAINSATRRKKDLIDIFVLFAQGREGLHKFSLDRSGSVAHRILAEFHPAFGSTHFELVDFDRDGREDILMTNGDNGDYPSPFKDYHGVRLLFGQPDGTFREGWRFPLNGAFKAIPADFDGDGDLDIAAISFFPNYEKSPEESFVLLENIGSLEFAVSSFPQAPLGRWIAMDAADADGDHDIDIVLGSFADGPASVPIPPDLRAHWNGKGPAVMFLENITKLR